MPVVRIVGGSGIPPAGTVEDATIRVVATEPQSGPPSEFVSSAIMRVVADVAFGGPYDTPISLGTPGETFTLDRDYFFAQNGIQINANDVTVDLNGHTLYYCLDGGGLANPGFELQGGSPDVPAYWDLTAAPNAKRVSNLVYKRVGSWSLQMPPVRQDEVIVSEWVELPFGFKMSLHALNDKYWTRSHHELIMELEHQSQGVVSAFQDFQYTEHWFTMDEVSDRGPYRVRVTVPYVARSEWQAQTFYNLGDTIIPVGGDDTREYQYWWQVIRIGGVSTTPSGATEPSWNRTLGAITNDNGIEWKCVRVGAEPDEYVGRAWEPNKEYGLNSWVHGTPFDGYGYKLHRSTALSAESGITEPAWIEHPRNSPSTIDDGQITWRYYEYRTRYLDEADITVRNQHGIVASKTATTYNGVTVRNGRIYGGYGSYSAGVVFSSASGNMLVEDVDVEVFGTLSAGIHLTYMDGAIVRRCTVRSHNRVTFNRHHLRAPLNATISNNVTVEDCEVWGGTGWGGILGGNTNVTIQRNTVHTNSFVTNHYGIVLYYPGTGVSNGYVGHNTVNCAPGFGVSFDGNVGICEFNNITVTLPGEGWEAERQSIDCIRVNDYGNRYDRDLIVRNNICTVWGNEDPNRADIAGQKMNGIAVIAGPGCEFTDNQITVHHVHPNIVLSCMQPGSRTDAGVLYARNRMTSDQYTLMFGDYAVLTADGSFRENEYIEGDNPQPEYQLLCCEERVVNTVSNTFFDDPVIIGPGNLRHIKKFKGITNFIYEYEVRFTITIQGPPNVTVEAKDVNDVVRWSATTDGTGFAEALLPEFIHSENDTVEELNDYTITVGGVSKTVTVDAPKTITFP